METMIKEPKFCINSRLTRTILDKIDGAKYVILNDLNYIDYRYEPNHPGHICLGSVLAVDCTTGNKGYELNKCGILLSPRLDEVLDHYVEQKRITDWLDSFLCYFSSSMPLPILIECFKQDKFNPIENMEIELDEAQDYLLNGWLLTINRTDQKLIK